MGSKIPLDQICIRKIGTDTVRTHKSHTDTLLVSSTRDNNISLFNRNLRSLERPKRWKEDEIFKLIKRHYDPT